MPISVFGCWSVARIGADRAFSYRKPNSTLLENAIASITGCFMARRFRLICLTMLAGALFAGSADVLSRPLQDSNSLTPIVEAAPTLAPFQHVRFCLRYPSDCKANPTENERIDLNAETSELLKRVNHSVNISIIPMPKSYGPNLGDGWTIAPEMRLQRLRRHQAARAP
jgi:Bacterial transglutaminase-like cysteine proteinase BTLCP